MSVAGFSLGNESCHIGLARKGGIDVIQNEVSVRKNETLVAFNGKERFICSAANTQVVTNAKNTVSQIKRLIGRRFQDKDVQNDMKHFPFTVKPGEGNFACVEVMYNDKRQLFTPQQILAMILKRLAQTAEWANDGLKLADLVLSVPVFFTDVQRQAILDAAKIAGLHCIRLFNEGTAIALSYGIYRSAQLPETEPLNVMFVDMGHAQLTATVVSFLKGKLTVRSAAYDTNLGGRNIDIALFDHFVGEIKKKYKMDITGNAKASVRLLAACEKLKKTLSGNAESTIAVESLQEDKDVSFPYSRAEMEKLIEPFGPKIAVVIKQAVAESGLQLADIPTIEIVGGSMRVPMIKKAILEVTGKAELSTTLNLDEAVARGSALQAAILSPLFKVREFLINDICAYPISVSWKAGGDSAGAAAGAAGAAGGDTMDVETSTEDDSANAAKQATGTSGGGGNAIFPLRNPIPSNKVLTFKRKSDQIDLTAYYDKPSLLPDGVAASIGKYTIYKIPSEAQKIKVKVKLDLHGIVRIENAQALEDFEVEEPAPASAPTTAASTPKSPSTNDVSKTDAADGMKVEGEAAAAPAPAAPAAAAAAPAAAAPAAAPVMVKKTKTRRTDLPIDSFTNALLPKTIEGFVEAELAMAAADKLLMETANAKNALEAYALDMRNKMAVEYAPYGTEADKSEFTKRCDETEEWLYGEGEDVSKGAYAEKLTSLQKLGDAIKRRKVEREVIPHHLKEMEALVGEFRKFASTTGDDVEQSEKDKVSTECASAETYLNDHRRKLQETPLTSDLAIASKDVEARKNNFANLCRPILKNPKKIKKEEPKKEEPSPAPAAAADAPAAAADAPAAAAGNGASNGEAADRMDVDK